MVGLGLLIAGREEGFCDIDGVSETVNAGFSGQEYLNSDRGIGAGITWHINTEQAGEYTVTLRFANGGSAPRPASLLINGQSAASLPFPVRSWTTWHSAVASVALDEGANKVELVAMVADGLPNIDYIKIEGSVSAGDCSVALPPSEVNFSREGDGDYVIQEPYGLSALARNVPAGTPRGRIENFTWSNSNIFPGTSRGVSVYIPQQYDRSEPLSLMVLHDGRAYINDFGLPSVLDNVIASGELPVMGAVFVDNADNYGRQRSAEYDCLNDRNARFMVEEILPEVERRYQIEFSTDPWKRAIGGHSSGGSAAFTAGWQRPDQFRRILTHSGSFTELCASGPDGYTYPGLIRDNPVKPLRVFLLTGTFDNGWDAPNDRHSWVRMNQLMSDALGGMGYHRRFVFAEGGSHNRDSGASILPETLRWLWRAPLEE